MTLLSRLRSLLVSRRKLKAGDRLRLFGGHKGPPEWLHGATDVSGRVEGFIPSDAEGSDVVVRLDQPITFDQTTGDILVMSQRYAERYWSDRGTVHLELCDFSPDPKARKARRQGVWIESHAEYELK